MDNPFFLNDLIFDFKIKEMGGLNTSIFLTAPLLGSNF